MSRYIPVEPEKWGEMVKAMAEVKRLQAEVEHLTSENQLVREESDRHYQLWVDSQAALNSSDHAVWTLAVENTRLKAENERLRKLGTEMGKHLPDTDEANRAYIDFEAGGRQ
jgi:regulator of replication initiation timing